jgi:hypothetical protein
VIEGSFIDLAAITGRGPGVKERKSINPDSPPLLYFGAINGIVSLCLEASLNPEKRLPFTWLAGAMITDNNQKIAAECARQPTWNQDRFRKTRKLG